MNTRHTTSLVDPAMLAEFELRRSAAADWATPTAPRIDRSRQRHDGNLPEEQIPSEREPSSNTRRQPVILIPFEATAESLTAVKAAVNLAAQTGARLVLFHAVHLNLTPYGPANPAWLKVALRQEAVTMAEPLMRFAQALGVSVICAVEEGARAATIASAAKKWEADVIVLTAQQRGRLARWFEKRALNRVIRVAECPVMVLDANFNH